MADEEQGGPQKEDDKKEDDKKGDEKKGGGQKEDKKDGGKEAEKPKKRLPRWPFILAAIVVAVFVGVVLYIIFGPRPDVWTDDAYVTVHYATIAPRVSGQVTSVDVTDNQIVRAGQVLVTLDPRDYQASVDMAQGALDRDQAQVGNATANVARQPSLITEQEAGVASARAKLSFSQMNQKRYASLAATGAGSGQEQQQTNATLQQDQASLQSAQASLDAARKQLDVLQKQQSSSEGTVKSDQAQLDQAKLNLSYTRILAPLDGMVGQKTVQIGNIVSPGSEIMAVVPLADVFIEANYRETDLTHMRPGQHVTIHVDAYNIYLDGVVNSVPPATNSTFAQIAPNNATGNFTKIVQRLPVKIVVSPNQPLAKLLRVGFSVETTVHTGLEDVVAEQDRTSRPMTAP